MKHFRVHVTNISAMGPSQLVQSLLPALENRPAHVLDRVYLPARGPVAGYTPMRPKTEVTYYRRTVPNSLSRLLECTIFGRRFDGPTPLLVLGDLPLRSRSRQTVLLHNRFVLEGDASSPIPFMIRSAVYRRVFAHNLRYASAVVVQSDAMKDKFVARFPQATDRIDVIGQPAPRWLLDSGIRRVGRATPDGKLRLVYPAASYPHKNHQLLAEIAPDSAHAWPVTELVLTIPPTEHPNPAVTWIRSAGLLPPPQLLQTYAAADGMLFLSRMESYGLPLIEAMTIGLPIVCPDLPYARTTCGDQAIYFDVDSVASLRKAVDELTERLASGWWPDWTRHVDRFPRSWADVADRLLARLFAD